MISEERLRELIEQQGTIYCSSDNVWYPIRFPENKGRIRNGYFEYKVNNPLTDCYWSEYIELNHLFENEEEAEEYLKYSNVTRTEKFPYVSWGEFTNKGRFSFKGKYGSFYVLKQCGDYIYIEDNFSQKELFTITPFTRENYHKALDLAVKLFKGEE